MIANDFPAHLTNWLARNGYRLPEVPAFTFDYDQPGATSTEQGIRFNPKWRPHVERLAARYGKRGRLDPSEVQTLEKVLHEMLHQPLMRREPKWYGDATPDDRLWEEAAAEQASMDLLPAAAKQLFGFAYRPPKGALDMSDPVLRDRTKRQRAYQQMSTIATGSKKYQDRAARQWRREFLNAPTARRVEMRTAAAARRAA